MRFGLGLELGLVGWSYGLVGWSYRLVVRNWGLWARSSELWGLRMKSYMGQELGVRKGRR